MIAVALPGLIDDLDASVASATWLITAYLIVMASVQPLAGKLGDSMGRRNLILGSLALFGVVSIGASLAPGIWPLLGFRVGQALAISVALSNGFAMVRQVVPTSRRARTFGFIETATSVSAVSGPLIGGLLLIAFDWRAIFIVNIPIVALALWFAWRSLPRDAKQGALSGFDYPGTVLLPAALVSVAIFFLFIARGEEPVLYVPTGVAAIALSGLLVRYERRHPDPVFQLGFYRVRGFAAPSFAVGTSNLAMYSLLLVVPLLMTERGGYSELEIGLVLTSLSVGTALLPPVGGRLADRFGRRNPVIAGLGIAAVATLLPAFSGLDIGIAPLVISLGVLGMGLGLSNVGMRTSAVESIAARNAGAAAGAYSTSRYLGSIVGSAVLAGLIGADRTNTDGMEQVFIVVAVAAFAAAASGVFMVSRPAVEE